MGASIEIRDIRRIAEAVREVTRQLSNPGGGGLPWPVVATTVDVEKQTFWLTRLFVASSGNQPAQRWAAVCAVLAAAFGLAATLLAVWG